MKPETTSEAIENLRNEFRKLISVIITETKKDLKKIAKFFKRKKMHSTMTNNIIFIHNGDYDGDVIIRKQLTNEEITVDFEDLKCFIANYIRDEKIRHLENCTDDEILFQQVKK